MLNDVGLNVDELILTVAQRAGISSAQATLAVSVTLNYLTARLPSSVVGCIREQLGVAQLPHNPDDDQGNAQ